MDQLNVQQTWLPIPGVEKHAEIDTIDFIFHKEKLKIIKAAYVRAVCDIRPHKVETHRKILTAGGNIIDYPGDVSTSTSYLTTTKLHVNSDILDVKSRYMCMEIKYFS